MAGTTVVEIAEGIYRISTPVDTEFGGFSFNQFLVAGEAPLLFHTGARGLFEATRGAVARVLPPESLRFVGWSHSEPDECGALEDFLALAPGSTPLTGSIGAMLSSGNFARPARALADGEALALGKHELVWIDAPHVPHGWDCGFLFERRTRTLLCGDLFTQGGKGETALTTGDVLGPSEAMRAGMDYYAHAPSTRATLERLAALEPRTLACMHGSAFEGDGAALLRGLADAVERR